MYSCESWAIKKAECQRIATFELWCWKRLLRVLCTARRSNQSILKEISPEYSLEGLMLKLKLQYFGHLMQRTDSLEKTLVLGRIEGRRRRGQQRIEMVGWHHQLDGHEFEQAPGVGDGQGSLVCRNPRGRKESDMIEWLNWMNNNMVSFMVILDQEWTNPRTVWWEESTKTEACLNPEHRLKTRPLQAGEHGGRVLVCSCFSLYFLVLLEASPSSGTLLWCDSSISDTWNPEMCHLKPQWDTTIHLWIN